MSKLLSLKSPVSRMLALIAVIVALGAMVIVVAKTVGVEHMNSGPVTTAEAGIASHGPAPSGGISDLLPSGGLGAAWSKTNPVGLGDLQGQQFLQTPEQYGINTIGTSKKNQSYDIRPTFPVPRVDVGPWLKSSIEPDPYWKGVEVGIGPQ